MIKVDALSYICLPLSYTPHQLLCLARCFVHTEITTNVFKWNKNYFYATWEELKFIRGKEHKFRMRLSAPQSKITQKFWHLRKKTKKHGLLPERHLTVARTLTTVHVHLCSPKDPSKGIWVTSEAFMTACQTLRRKQEEADSLFLLAHCRQNCLKFLLTHSFQKDYLSRADNLPMRTWPLWRTSSTSPRERRGSTRSSSWCRAPTPIS